MPTQVGYSRLGHLILPISGKPEIGAVLILRDARTRVPVCGTFSARALLRMRTSITAHDLKQHALHRSRGALLRPGFVSASPTPRTRGGGAPRNVRVRVRHPLGVPITAFTRVFDAMNAARQALARRLVSRNAGRSPLRAPPWPPSPAHSRFRGEERTEAYATPRSAFRIVSGGRPSRARMPTF